MFRLKRNRPGADMIRISFATLILFSALLAAPASAAVESEAAYLARCKQETVAAYPGARAQADAICSSKWGEVVAAAPIAETLLAVAPAPGKTFDAATAKKRAPLPGGLTLEAAPPVATIGWYAAGEPIPFNLEDALRGRGAKVSMIACLSFGVSEGYRAWKVEAPGKAPFALNVAFRNAALASQSSEFTATADYSGKLPTLAALQKDGGEWTASCPQ